jgi:hypothetical protein
MIGEGLERLRGLLPEGLLVIADSALGNLAPLCAADRAGLRFICPLRAVTGFRKHFLAEVGFEALHPLRYASERERRAPPGERSYRGALRPFEVRDPESGELRRLRVAYVHSSVEAREVAAAVVPNLRSRTRAGRADPDPPGKPGLLRARPVRGHHRAHRCGQRGRLEAVRGSREGTKERPQRQRSRREVLTLPR